MSKPGPLRFLFIAFVVTLLIAVCVAVKTETTCPSYLAMSRLQYTRWSLEDIERALELKRKESGSLPNVLSALVPDYLKVFLNDAWGNAFVYMLVPDGKGYVLYSRGRNGLDEQGAGDDITAAPKKFTCEQYEDVCATPCEIIKTSAYAIGFVSLIALLGLAVFVAVRSMKRHVIRHFDRG